MWRGGEGKEEYVGKRVIRMDVEGEGKGEYVGKRVMRMDVEGRRRKGRPNREMDGGV